MSGWKKGDVLRLRCGWGVACWKRSAEEPDVKKDWCCVRLGQRSHECIVIALESSEEGKEGYFFRENGSWEWEVFGPYGLAYFSLRRRDIDISCRLGEIISIIE